jgi:hypothetical protein
MLSNLIRFNNLHDIGSYEVIQLIVSPRIQGILLQGEYGVLTWKITRIFFWYSDLENKQAQAP